VETYLQQQNTDGLDIRILSPKAAMAATLERARAGESTISVTGNVLRDYLTDLFPILELGTSAKMLSIVPLLAGGGMYETGAGGSAPKHVQQFVKEGHLRWDSLGEFLALAVSLEDVAMKTRNALAGVLAKTLNDAVGELLNNGKNPSRKVKELDNRGSHFYLALYWAKALATQTESPGLQMRFAPVAAQLGANEARILEELLATEGQPVDLGGYFNPDPFLLSQAMRPSATLNTIIDALDANFPLSSIAPP
jgi:isocitrate dehydrogenase